MNRKVKQIIIITSFIVIGLYLLILSLYKAKSFLIPVVIAILLSMVMLPVAKKFEKWGLSRGLAVLASDLIILLFCFGLITMIGLQVKGISENWSKYKPKVESTIQKVESFVKEKAGISLQEQFQKQQSKSGMQKKAGEAFSKTFSFLGNFLLVFVYIFFFMYYRDKFFNSVLKFFSEEKRETAAKTLEEFASVTQQYMFGRFLLILALAVLYSIGLSIVGVKHAIVVSLLAAVLSLLPYIGNILGYAIALMMALIVKGGTGALIGVSVVFAVSQLFESYFLEPYLVGKRVNLNPVLVIVGVVAGGAVWGVAGMLVAIPVMGMFKVLFDKIPHFEPMGYLLGEEDMSSSSEPDFFRKIKKKFSKKE